ncbi:DUF6252 family protein [Flavobacterium sp.]|uniref:DUF6252 family protein n=1 Tax=Flavobacterium sp. TaxID=239 RepID=UPI00286EA5D4|nr:DUF6252 family protein [Flavobacterium sp.]
MKTTILKSILAVIMITLSLTSCNKDEEAASPPPPPGLPEFLYGEGGAASLSPVTNPFANASSKEIFGRNGSSEVIKIKLTSLAVATYTIGVENEFTYTRPTTSSPWIAGTGTITITSNIGNKLSGTFDLTSGTSILGINQVNGRFSDIVINP